MFHSLASEKLNKQSCPSSSYTSLCETREGWPFCTIIIQVQISRDALPMDKSQNLWLTLQWGVNIEAGPSSLIWFLFNLNILLGTWSLLILIYSWNIACQVQEFQASWKTSATFELLDHWNIFKTASCVQETLIKQLINEDALVKWIKHVYVACLFCVNYNVLFL